MNSAARFLVVATACTTLLIAGAAVEPASAQDVCKDNTVTASGRAKFRPFTKTKELEGRGSAMADAVVNWQKEVREKYGDKWDTWSRAKGTNFECAPTKSGKIIGSSFIGCTISGKPCSNGSSKGPVAEGRRDGADDGDRRDGRDRYRRRIRTAYDMEMAYQDRLAERRKRAEARLWARENRRQDYLTRQREREAIWAFKRSTYYGEYGTYRRYRAYNRYRSYRHYGHDHYGYRHYNYDRYCDCAPYAEYRLAPLFDFGFFHRSSYHCAEP